MLDNKRIPRSMKGLVRDRIAEIIKKGFLSQDEQLDFEEKSNAQVFVERALPWAAMDESPRVNVSYAKMELDESASSAHWQHHDYTFNVDVILGKAHEVDETYQLFEGDTQAAIGLAEITNVVYMILMAGENDNLGFPRKIGDRLVGDVAQQFITSEEVFQPANADGTQIQVIGSRLVVQVRTRVEPFDVDGVPLVEMLHEYCEANVGKLGEVLIIVSEEEEDGN